MLLRFIFIVLLFLTATSVLPGQQIVEVVQIEKDDGLKDRTVDRIIRDRNGYFILFMLNTIQRYDGKKFENIDVSAIKTNKLEVRDIDKIDMLTDGTIILNMQDSDYLFYIENKQNRVSFTPLKGSPLVNQGKLYVLKPKGLDSEAFHLHQAELTSSLTSEKLSSTELTPDIVEMAKTDNLTYLQKSDLSIQLLKENHLIDIPLKGKLIQRDNGVYVFGKDKIYKLFGTEHQVVVRLNKGSSNCNILKLDDNQNMVSAYSGRVRFQDNVYVLDNSDSLHTMDNIIEVSDVFKDFHTDDAFHRWMLGGYNGIHIVNLLRDGSRILKKREDIKKGEFGNVISGVASDGKEEVVFTHESAGMYSYDYQNNAYKEEMEKPRLKGDYQRNAKLYFSDDTKTYLSHAYRYDGKSDIYITDLKTETYQKFVVPYKLNDVYSIDDHTIIFGGYISKTTKGILGIYDTRKKSYEIIRVDTREIRSITFDKQTNTYWIGTYEGLYVLDKDFNTIALFDRDKSDQKLLAQDHIVMTARYRNWMIAGSYSGGVYVIDPERLEVIKKIDESNGLNDNAAIGILNDDLGNCWIATFNGISVIDSNLNVIHKIYENDGLPNREFNSKALAKDGLGNIYGGTLNGVVALDPSKVLKWKKSHQFDIKSVIGHKGKNLERLNIEDEIPLYEAYDSLVINYNCPDYHYYPYVDEIIAIHIDGEMDYTLAENKIILKNIQAGDNNVKISIGGITDQTVLKINTHSNIKKTVSIFFIAIAIGLLAWFISRKIIKSNKIKEAEQTKINKRMADLQLSSLQSQMNPHFIFNALGSIQYFIQTYDTVKADEFLTNFAMLMRSILESSKSKYISLKEEIKLLKLYVGLEKIRFENLFEYTVEIDENLDLESNIPPMMLQPFVENAINHGLYHLKGRKGVLKLKFESLNPDTVKITITDNGIGRKAAAKYRNKNHKSRGMQIVNERLETINGSGELTVDITTIDIEKDGRAHGTEVSIVISEIG